MYRETADDLLSENSEANNGRGDQYTFEFLNRCVIDAIQFVEIPREKRTVVAAAMVDILEAERKRIARVKEWNRKNETNPG